MRDDFSLLDCMLADQRAQEGIYRPGEYWEPYAQRIVRALREDGIEGFRSNSRIGKGYADTIETDPMYLIDDSWKGRLYKKLLRSKLAQRFLFQPYVKVVRQQAERARVNQNLYLEQFLGDWFREFSAGRELPDAMIADPGEVMTIAGKEMGRAYLKAFLRVHNFSRRVEFDKLRVVFEIGGGFGATVHTLATLFPNARKFVYLDIPPMLYIGTQYLKEIFGDAVIDYRRSRDTERLVFRDDDSLEILAIAPWQIERLETPVDLFWNCASMQEMDRETVANYSRHVGRLLRDEHAKLCMFIYHGGSADRTVLEPELLELVGERAGVSFERLPDTIDVSQGDYFVGGRSSG